MTAAGQPRQPLKGVPSSPGDTPRSPRSPSVTEPSRSPGPPSALLHLSHRLTARDLHLARLLTEHRTLTTNQITALLFTHPGTARNRLRQLLDIGFLDRFTHRTPTGARLTCWVPGLLAARYTALADDRPPPTPRAVRAQQDRILANPQLDHLLGVNQFFTDLAHHARTHPDTRLVRWWSAERTAAAHAGRIHPDGHGIWQTDHKPEQSGAGSGTTTAGFWLEHDTGSMPVPRIAAKLAAYRALQEMGGPRYVLLLWLPSPSREAHVHEALSRSDDRGHLVVATGVHDRGTGDPAGTSWWAAPPRDGRRVAAAEAGERVPLSALQGTGGASTLPPSSDPPRSPDPPWLT